MVCSLDILLADANDESRDLYVEGLSWIGFSVKGTALPSEAIEEAGSAQVLIVDLSMCPSFDGLGLLGELRRSHPGKPIVVLSTRVADADRELARAAGADVFLAKPCLPQCLARHVCRVLERSHLSPSRPLRLSDPLCLNPQHRDANLFDLHRPPAPRKRPGHA